jgi:hypothetical protein
MLTTSIGSRPRPHFTDPVGSNRSKVDRINTRPEPEPERRQIRMEDSSDQNMAPPAEGRRSSTTNPMLGARSGTSTPKGLAASMTPVPQSSVSSSRFKAIVKNFSLYTHAVVHRDTVKARLERQSHEKDRWQKHYHGFVIMAEEQFGQLRKSQVSSVLGPCLDDPTSGVHEWYA